MARTSNAVQAFEWKPFSVKQKKLLTWWTDKSPHRNKDMVIADGSIRAGKTVAMVDSFITWSQVRFQSEQFILAGKSMGALKRNVIEPLQKILAAKGIPYRYIRSSDSPHIQIGSNIYYLFGANNEKSQDTLQGLTAAGALLDEAALMPKSFVDQAIGRCSVEGSKIWMNCNPAGPYHYLKTDYIDQAKEKNILHLHFTLDDNPALSPKIKERYKRMFSGVFYQRYILGLWVMAEGIIYDQFDHINHVVDQLPDMKRYWVGVDYGTSNATAFILAGLGVDDRLYIIDEYYHSGVKSGRQKSPSQYRRDFRSWLDKQVDKYGNKIKPEYIYVDPSAEGFILELWNDGVKNLVKADNTVKRGIELVSSIISNDRFRVHKRCKNVLQEISSYVWDPKAQERGEDEPIKQNDHTMDPIRYIANSTRQIWQRRGIAA